VNMDCGINAFAAAAVLTTGAATMIAEGWINDHVVAVNAAGNSFQRAYSRHVGRSSSLIAGVAFVLFGFYVLISWFGDCAAALALWSTVVLWALTVVGLAFVGLLLRHRLRIDFANSPKRVGDLRADELQEERTSDGKFPRMPRDRRRALQLYAIGAGAVSILVGVVAYWGTAG
jgi:hypothetical protein